MGGHGGGMGEHGPHPSPSPHPTGVSVGDGSGNVGHWGGVGWGYPYWAVYPDWYYPDWNKCSKERVIENCAEECTKGVQQCKDCFNKNC
jgi:hypothetical protein